MKIPALAPVVLVLAALVGCAAPTDPAPEAVGREASAATAYAPFPPRVEEPIGASRDAICKDLPAKGTNPAYLAHMEGRTPWQHSDVEHFDCIGCMLDGQVITQPYVSIHESSAIGVRFEPAPVGEGMPGPVVDLSGSDARGATFTKPTNLLATNTDLRCASGTVTIVAPSKDIEWATKNVDLSGFVGDVTTAADVTDLRMTGAVGTARLEGNLTDVRFDGMVGDAEIAGEKVTGKLVFDHTKGDLELYDKTTFDGATISLGGATGTIRLAPSAKVVLKGVTFEGADGGMKLGGSLEKLGFAGKTAWPVGERSPLPDASLTKVDFSGAILAPPGGEAWPKAPLVLDGLKLTGGGFGPGVDLTKVSLHGAHLEGVDFGKVLLSTLDGQRAVGVDFQDAHLDGAIFVGPEDNRPISGVTFTGAGLRGADLSGVSGAATFDRIDAGVDPGTGKATTFARAILHGSTFDQAGIQYTSFEGAHLDGVGFGGATSDFADFTNASFGANQTLASVKSLNGATFDGADLRGVNLSGVDLSSASGKTASFADALLCGANLTNAKMHGARLTHAKMDVDGNVKLPSGELVPCTPGPHDGLDTSSIGDPATVCPDATHPEAGASCTGPQWKQEGVPSCTHRGRTIRGFACSSDCDCASTHCGATGTCL